MSLGIIASLINSNIKACTYHPMFLCLYIHTILVSIISYLPSGRELVRKLMKSNTVMKIIVVTSLFHIERSRYAMMVLFLCHKQFCPPLALPLGPKGFKWLGCFDTFCPHAQKLLCKGLRSTLCNFDIRGILK